MSAKKETMRMDDPSHYIILKKMVYLCYMFKRAIFSFHRNCVCVSV